MKIPIKRYVDDPSLPWDARYRRLEDHHRIETEWLVGEVERLRGGLLEAIELLAQRSREPADVERCAQLRKLAAPGP
jgi:hypothetical protein